MVTTLIVLLLFLIGTIIAVAFLGVGGLIASAVFSDFIVFGLIVWLIVHLIRKRNK